MRISISRRLALAGGLVAGAAAVAGGVVAAGRDGGSRREKGRGRGDGGVITVPGGAVARSTIPVRDGRVTLDTVDAPPPEGWFAEYAVEVPGDAPGVHRVTAVVTAPMEQPHTEDTGSFFSLAVDGGTPVPVSRSQPYWYESPAAARGLSRCELGDIELAPGRHTLTFTVGHRVLRDAGMGYLFLLDGFTLTPVPVGLREIVLGDPDRTLGVYTEGTDAALAFRLNGRAPEDRSIPYRVLADRSSRPAASGTVTVRAGETSATAAVPAGLPPGHYRVMAAGRTAHFACLPRRRGPLERDANRFGVNVFSDSLVPPDRRPALSATLREAGIGWVREGASWPAARPTPDAPYDDRHFEDTVRVHRDAGLSVLGVVYEPPAWAVTGTSLPLPADLREAFRYLGHLTAPDAVQLSNEPDVDATASTADRHAAYVKAAALGARRPVVLPGIAGYGPFQDLMLRSGVARYADVWGFHGYGWPPGDDPEFPDNADEQRERRDASAPGTPMWMTESGAFLPAGPPGTDLTHEQQLVQARYLVLSTAESLAAGTARQFWFCGPPCTDDGVCFGLFSRDFQPWPAFSAYAAMTAVLGRADFVRVLDGLSRDAVGFVFGDGDRTVTVLYAPAGRVTVPVPGATRVEVRTMTGALRETLTPSASGTVRVRPSPDPLYLVTDAPPPPGPGPVPPRRGPRLSAADRIVLDQRFAAGNAAPDKEDGDAPPPLGYRLGATTRVSVDVYNFGDAPAAVAVTARTAGGWTAEPAGAAEVEVPPMGRAAVGFTLTADPAAVRPGRDYDLVFEGVLGGRPTTPSVSRVQFVTGQTATSSRPK